MHTPMYNPGGPLEKLALLAADKAGSVELQV